MLDGVIAERLLDREDDELAEPTTPEKYLRPETVETASELLTLLLLIDPTIPPKWNVVLMLGEPPEWLQST
jgi:hypothetical protein